MRVIGFDTETALILPGLQAPPVACLSWAERRGADIEVGLVSGEHAAAWLKDKLQDPEVLLVGHNTAYDAVACAAMDTTLLSLLFAKYRAGQVHCTMLREQLRDLSKGKLGSRRKGYYTLDNLTEGGLDKTTWRLGYGPLIRVSFDEWPDGARQYALTDARATLELWERQGTVADDAAQARAGFVFRLMQTWGMRTDEQRVLQLESHLRTQYRRLRKALREYGILREDGVQNMALTRSLIEQTYIGGAPPRTKKTNSIKTGSDVVNACTHQGLLQLAEYKHVEKILSTYLPPMKRGFHEPLCPSINTLVKNGRSSYREPNLQNLPREGGVRECFIPRTGNVFVDCDYDTLEVRTFAQVLKDQGHGTTLAKEYGKDADFDPHCRLAAQILGITYDDAIRLKKAKDKTLKDTRQMSKAGNFGLAGGMGAETFVTYAWKSYGVRLNLEKSQWLKQEWLASVPEVKSYFEMCGVMTRNDQRARFEQIRSRRIRGGATFTDLANGYWSGLAADGAKWAGFNIAEACYAKPGSPLYGARPVVYIHDEYMLEAEEERGHEVGVELARIMQESMEDFTPDVPSRASPCLMRRWYKGAEPSYGPDGRLVPWEPQQQGVAA